MITATLSWTATQNVTGNSSSVTASLRLKSNSTLAPVPAWNGVTASITINGNTASSGITTGVSGGNTSGSKYTRTVTVPHNADGTKTFSFGFSINFSDVVWNGSRIGTVSHSGSGTLNTIPRASSIASISGGTLGSTLTVNITRASSSFTHKVGYYRTDGSRTMGIIENVGTSTSFTLPLSDASLLPSATTGTGKIIVDTYSGTTKIGSASKTFTVTVPSSVVPSITSFNLTENIEATKNIGLAANTFVKNKSQIAMTAGADGSYGSSIKDYTFSFNGASQGGTVGRQFNVGNITGNHTAKVVVTDSRGRTAELTKTAVILDYNPPKINGFSTWRDGSGVVKASVNCSVSILGGKGGTWYVDSGGGTSWTNRNSGSLTSAAPSYLSNITVVGTYPDSSSATFRLRVDDAFGAGPTAASSVSTSKTALSLYKDVGVGVGKRWEKGTLDVGGEVFIKGPSNMQPNTSNTLDNAQNILVNFRRPNGTLHSGFDIGGASDALRLHQYNSSGTWLSMHYFDTNGNVRFAKDVQASGRFLSLGGISTDGYIWAKTTISSEGAMYEAGRRVHADWTPPELWSGATYMTGSQTITPSKSLANCRNGWMLAWSDYTNGVANNYDWVFTPVPKTAISAGVNGMHAVVANSNAPNATMLSKYIYVGTGTSIVGHNNNNLAGLDNVVLRKVYEW